MLRTDDEGSEETMDTESQQKSTLSNEVYKQASLDVSSLVVFSHSTYRKPREDAITNYVIRLKSKTCIFMACVASLAFRASCSMHVLAQKSFQLAPKRNRIDYSNPVLL